MKTIVIGLDAATWEILKPLINSGQVPTIRNLCEKGVSGILKSSVSPLTPPAWTSMVTGVNPGKHGIYDFLEQDPKTYEVRPINYSRMKRKAIWNVFSEAGKKVIIVNFPMAYPPPQVNGVFISGIGSPEDGVVYYPSNLKQTLKRINYRVHPQVSHSEVGSKSYAKHLRELMRTRFALCTFLAKTNEWDLFWGVWNEIDWAQHYMWHDRKILFSLYEEFDKLLGIFLSHFKENNCNVWICSDHGMKAIDGEIHFNNLLRDWGMLKLIENHGKTNVKRRLLQHFDNNLDKRKRRIIKKYLPKWLTGMLKAYRGKIGVLAQYENINWEETEAYSFGYFGKIYFNAKHDFSDSKLRRLKQRIMSLKNPHTGNNIFERIIEKDKAYKGKYLSDAPSLILIPKNWSYTIHNDFASKWYTKPIGRYADHKPKGVFIVKSSLTKNGLNLNMDICDVTPTVLAIHNLPIFDDSDGRPRQDLLKERISIQETSNTNYSMKSREKFTNIEKRDIEKNLKSLGYM